MSGKNHKRACETPCKFVPDCNRRECHYQHGSNSSGYVAAESRGRANKIESRTNSARQSSSSNSQYIRKEQSNTHARGVSHSNEPETQQRPQAQLPPFVFGESESTINLCCGNITLFAFLAMLSKRSQYSFPNGRSACTLIALAAAGCLGAIPRWNYDITSGESEKIMEMGIAWYERISVYLPTDHCAVDEAIQALHMCGEGLIEEPGLSMPYEFGIVGNQQVSNLVLSPGTHQTYFRS